MKALRIVFCASLFAIAPVVHGADPSPAPNPEVQRLLTEGQTAYTKGDFEAAKAAFGMIYQIDPRNTVAINFLRRIKAAESGGQKGVSRERTLGSIIIPKVEFHDATLREALDFLRKKVNELTEGKQLVNFVVPGGPATDSARVTLSLQNIPFQDAVKYIGKVTNFEFTFDKYAIVGKPLGETAAATAPATPSVRPQ